MPQLPAVVSMVSNEFFWAASSIPLSHSLPLWTHWFLYICHVLISPSCYSFWCTDCSTWGHGNLTSWVFDMPLRLVFDGFLAFWHKKPQDQLIHFPPPVWTQPFLYEALFVLAGNGVFVATELLLLLLIDLESVYFPKRKSLEYS